MRHSVAHIINPFIASETSDLFYAQPITFESMIVAREKSKHEIDVELMAVSYEEDVSIIPSGFKRTEFLSSSVLDYHAFEHKIKLPLIREILQRAFDESSAEYIVYTNIDIGLFPDFYLRLKTLLDARHDALIINRNRMEPTFLKTRELEKIWQQSSKSHPGFDCFVFHRKFFEKLKLENVCIGVPFIEIGLSQNLFHLSENFGLIESDRYTFHLGMEIFRNRAPREYFYFNRREYHKAEKNLWKNMKLKNLPFRNLWLPFRLIKWAFHPCIPIRLALKLLFK